MCDSCSVTAQSYASSGAALYTFLLGKCTVYKHRMLKKKIRAYTHLLIEPTGVQYHTGHDSRKSNTHTYYTVDLGINYTMIYSKST
jgi:hypothetical protein